MLTVLMIIACCFAYFGMIIGTYLILKKIDKDTDSDDLRWLSVCWPLWVGLVPIIAIGRAIEIIFDKIDEDTNEKDK